MIGNYTYCNAECEKGLVAAPCKKLEIRFSQVQGVIIVPNQLRPDNWEEDWDGIINNSAEGFGKYIPIRGSVKRIERKVVDLARNQESPYKNQYQLKGRIDNLSDEYYAFLQRLQEKQYRCPQYSFWYETASGWLYGGAKGIRPDEHDGVLPLLINGIVHGQLIIDFSANTDVPRTRSTINIIEEIQSDYWLYPDCTEWEYPEGEFWEYP